MLHLFVYLICIKEICEQLHALLVILSSVGVEPFGSRVNFMKVFNFGLSMFELPFVKFVLFIP